MTPRISVLMGIYNCADTLGEAIDSILAQTYTGWKLILCDDGSTDSTYQIAAEYRERYPDKIILLRNTENMGLNHTLNRCLAEADTEYCARMDGDDISLPERFAREIEFLDTHPEYAVVSTNMAYFDENGIWGESHAKAVPTGEDLAVGTPFCHAPCMIRTTAYRAVGGYTEEKRLLRVEDYHLWVKLYTAGYAGANLEETLYQMRDDRNAARRRKYRYRINEAYVRILAIKQLQLPKRNFRYVLRPLLVGLLPEGAYAYLHKKRIQKGMKA